jgi:hypothetical protein
MYPLPFAPTTGDAFTVAFGCNHTQATCQGTFNNLANFRGFAYVPPPELAYWEDPMSNFCGTIGKTTVQARADRDGRGVTMTIHDASGYRLAAPRRRNSDYRHEEMVHLRQRWAFDLQPRRLTFVVPPFPHCPDRNSGGDMPLGPSAPGNRR